MVRGQGTHATSTVVSLPATAPSPPGRLDVVDKIRFAVIGQVASRRHYFFFHEQMVDPVLVKISPKMVRRPHPFLDNKMTHVPAPLVYFYYSGWLDAARLMETTAG